MTSVPLIEPFWRRLGTTWRLLLKELSAFSEMSLGINPKPFLSVKGPMYSQRKPKFNERFGLMRHVSLP